VLVFDPGDPAPFRTAVITSGVPPSGNETVHLNLWLASGAAPSGSSSLYQAIISRFEFIPIVRPCLKVTGVTATATQLLLQYTP
jgi:hypothetical protein